MEHVPARPFIYNHVRRNPGAENPRRRTYRIQREWRRQGSENKEGNQLHYDRERQSCTVLRRPADRHRNSTLESFSIMGKNDHSIQGVNRGGSSDRNLLRRRSGGYRSRKCNLVMRSEDRRDNRNEMPERMPGKSRRAYRSQTLRKTCGPFLMDRGLVR